MADCALNYAKLFFSPSTSSSSNPNHLRLGNGETRDMRRKEKSLLKVLIENGEGNEIPIKIQKLFPRNFYEVLLSELRVIVIGEMEGEWVGE